MDIITSGFQGSRKTVGIALLVLGLIFVLPFSYLLLFPPENVSDDIGLQMWPAMIILVGIVIIISSVFQFRKINNFNPIYDSLKGGKDEFEEASKDLDNILFQIDSIVVGKKYMAFAGAAKDIFVYMDDLAMMHVEKRRVKYNTIYSICYYEEGKELPITHTIEKGNISRLFKYFSENHPEIVLGYDHQLEKVWKKNPNQKALKEAVDKLGSLPVPDVAANFFRL